jgi:hypothetical protein
MYNYLRKILGFKFAEKTELIRNEDTWNLSNKDHNLKKLVTNNFFNLKNQKKPDVLVKWLSIDGEVP